MAVTLDSLAALAALDFDDIIDVRSPAEFAEDHVPGAISLPVLDNEERARVGTIYKQDSPFKARKIGAALVARNAARHLEDVLIDRPGGWRPLVYCWRGGQRSGSFATILTQVGWRAETLVGGYKSYRSLVVKALYDTPIASPLIVLDGNTGSGKTDILHALAARGHQVVDLEGLASHRGSLFGAVGVQPAQRGFETALALALSQLDPARPVVVEAESSKVGDCRLPPRLWAAMTEAPRVVLEVPLEARADYLTRAYADLVEDPDRTRAVIGQLRSSHPAERIEDWLATLERAEWPALAEGLMRHHYDPRYGKHRSRMEVPLAVVQGASLDAAGIAALAGQVELAIAGLLAKTHSS
jgi:tRNA 2-selenouridine synthase